MRPASSNWNSESLSELVDAVREQSRLEANKTYELWSIPSFADGKPEIIKGSDIGSSKLKVSPGDVLISKINPRINRVWIVSESNLEQLASPEWLVARIKDHEVIDKKYLSFYLSSPEFRDWISRAASSVTGSHSRAKANEILQRDIPFPEIDQQSKIVELLEEYLSCLDAALAEVKQAKIKAAQFRMSVLHSVFNSASNTADWDTTTLEKIGVWKTGSTPLSKNPEFQGTDVKFVTPGDIGFGGKLSTVARTISNEGADSVRRVTPPSVHLVCIGTIGKVAWTNEIVTTNQQINSLEVDASKNNPEFLMWLIASPEIQEKLWANSSSTTVPILNKGKLEKIACKIPSLETQNEVIKFIDTSFAKLDAVLKTLHLLENHSSILRSSLLQAAFTGQLTKEVASV